MPAELLTASDVSTRLGVDRSTVYRMASDGRLRAVKVGSQWRFPPAAVEQAVAAHDGELGRSGGPSTPALLRVARSAVLEACAPLLGAMMVVTDMRGRLLTDVINPCPWFVRRGSDPAVLEACTTQWRHMAADHVLTPRLEDGPHGFACGRGFVRDGDRLVGIVVAGGIAPDPDDPAAARAAGLFHLDRDERRRLLDELPRIAGALSQLSARPPATTGSTP